jgi:hypothetical protein
MRFRIFVCQVAVWLSISLFSSLLAADKELFELGGIAEGFEFAEITDSGKPIKIDKHRPKIPVDINSTVYIKVRPEGFPVKAVVSTELKLEDLSNKRKALMKSLESVRVYIKLVGEVNRLWDEIYTDKGQLRSGKTGADALLIRNKLEKRDELGEAVFTTFVSYLVESGRFTEEDSEKREEEIMDWITLVKGIDWIDDPQFAECINSEIGAIEEEIDSRIGVIKKSSRPGKLRIAARLIARGEPQSFIHMPGYDNLDSGDPNFIDRLSFQLDEKGRAELKKEVEFHRELASVINDLRDESSQLRQAITTTFDSLRANTDSLLREFKIDAIGEGLVEALKEAEDSIKANPDLKAKARELREKITELKSQWDSLKVKVKALRSLQAVGGLDPVTLLVDFPQQKIADIYKAKESFMALVDPTKESSLPKLFKSVDSLSKAFLSDKVLEKHLTASVKAELMSKINLLLSLKDSIEFDEDQLERVFYLIKILQENFAPIVSPSSIGIDEHPGLEIPIDEAHDTELQIYRTERREDDLIEFIAKFNPDSSDNNELEFAKFFEVKKFGLHSHVSGNMVFIKRKNVPVDVKTVNYEAFPAVSYTLRYRTRGGNWFNRLWDVMSPGFGINVAALNFEGNGVEVGIGATVSIFGDVVILGYGENLQADIAKKYTLVGIGLLEMLGQTRKLF